MSEVQTEKSFEEKVQRFDKWAFWERIGYHVHHKEVRRFHESDARIKVCVAPRRTTKSYSASYDVIPDIITKPGCVGWIVGPNYELSDKEFRYIYEALVHKAGFKPTWKSPSKQILEFPGNCVIKGKSAENESSLLGEALDWVIYSEAAEIKRGIRERRVAPALNTKKGREIVPTTPAAGAEWVHELWLAGQSDEFPEIETFQWDRRANPIYDEEEFDRARKFYGADSPVFREQYLGEWVFYGGMVYPQFQDSIHIIEPFDIPRGWPVIRGIDFGFRDPFVCLWAAVGPYGELYFFQEYYSREGKALTLHGPEIKARDKGFKITDTVGDPTETQAMEDLWMQSIACNPGNNDRSAGRIRVAEYLTPTLDGPPPFPDRNKPRIAGKSYPRAYFFSTLVETTREFRYYRWKEGRNVEKDVEKTEGEDHAMDVVRYICMTRPSPFKLQPRHAPGSVNSIMAKIRGSRILKTYIGG